MAIFKRCNFCRGLFTGDRCPKCANQHSKIRREKNEALKLYGSAKWHKCRENVRLKYMDYDIWELGVGRWIKLKKVVVHHIQEREERPDLIYDLDNLITVSVDSHAEIHAAYRSDRAGALERIQKGIGAFREVFGDGC